MNQQTLNQKLALLKAELFKNKTEFCRDCFKISQFKEQQNPPNVFRDRIEGDSVEFFFVFEKPNNNDLYRHYAPIHIHDQREIFNNQTRTNLLRILNISKNKDNGDDPLSLKSIHITNAVKCDKCSETGQSGRLEVRCNQVRNCLKKFFYRPRKSTPKSTHFFGHLEIYTGDSPTSINSHLPVGV